MINDALFQAHELLNEPKTMPRVANVKEMMEAVAKAKKEFGKDWILKSYERDKERRKEKR